MTAENRANDGDPNRPPARDGGRARSIRLETLGVLNRIGEIGVEGVEDRLAGAWTDDVTVRTDQVKVGYAAPENLGVEFSADQHVGAKVRVTDTPEGYVLVVFPIESAKRAAGLMLRSAVEDLSAVSTEMTRDALTELCNIMAIGFVDQWATLFDTGIDARSPVEVMDDERTLVRRIVDRGDVGLYIASRLTIPEYDIGATVYVFPFEEQFVTAISQVGLEVVDR